MDTIKFKHSFKYLNLNYAPGTTSIYKSVYFNKLLDKLPSGSNSTSNTIYNVSIYINTPDNTRLGTKNILDQIIKVLSVKDIVLTRNINDVYISISKSPNITESIVNIILSEPRY